MRHRECLESELCKFLSVLDMPYHFESILKNLIFEIVHRQTRFNWVGQDVWVVC
jgi:hypothetical protein